MRLLNQARRIIIVLNCNFVNCSEATKSSEVVNTAEAFNTVPTVHTNVLPTLIRRILDVNNVFKAPNPLFSPLERLCLRVVDHHTEH